MRCFRGTTDYALWIRSGREMVISGYCDADLGGDNSDRMSTIGIMLQVGRTPVLWRNLKQKTVTLSITEDESSILCEAKKMV